MSRRLLPVLLLMCAGLPAAVAAIDSPPLALPAGVTALAQPGTPADQTTGRVERVTVYRGQAQVTRVIDASGPAGFRELVVTDLPPSIQAGTLYAEGADGIEIRAVRFRTRPVEQDVRAEVRKADDELRTLNDQLTALNADRARIEEQRAYTKRLEDFVAPTAQTELKSGVLNAETLVRLSDYIAKQRDTLGERDLELQKKIRDVQTQIELRQRERAKLTAGSSRSVNEAVIFLNKDRAGNQSLRLLYVVNNASWSPSYSARADGAGGLTLESYASVQQMTGEDWDNVELELSTATPRLVAKAPELNPMTIALAAEVPQDSLGYADAKAELQRQRQSLEQLRNRGKIASGSPRDEAGIPGAPGAAPAPSMAGTGGGGPGGLRGSEASEQAALDSSLNTLSQNEVLLDLIAGRRATGDARPLTPREESLSVSYALNGRTSLPSRADQQLIQIAASPLKAEFYKVAKPGLTAYVFDEARATNTSGMVLLAGPVAAYSNGTFVGHGELATVAAGESFTVGFGIDASLRAVKELVQRSENTQGGNKIIDATYELRIENFGSAPAHVRVFDALPTSQGNDIKVTLSASKPEPVTDLALVAKIDRAKREGLKRWDVVIPPVENNGAAAPTAVIYTLRIEHDRQMRIITKE